METAEPERFRVEEGRVLVYRLFDVADAIDLDRAQSLAAEPRSRFRLEAARRPGALEIPRPPLHVGLGRRRLPLTSGEREATASAHLFDHGVASVVYALPLPAGITLAELVPLAEELVAKPTPELDAAARAEMTELCRQLGPALDDPHAWEGIETYTVFLVRRLAGAPPAAEVLASAPLAELLLGETSPVPLSRQEREDVLRNAFSYLADDLAVVDWDSAFLLEPSGAADLPDLLELATAHLLELRFYDALLDRELSAIYDELGERRAIPGVFSRRYARLQRHTAALLLELSETTERLGNAVKIVGDLYLARVYQGAARRFRVPAWEESVLKKQQLLAGVNKLLEDSADTRRAELLELTIIVLILWEILYALLR